MPIPEPAHSLPRSLDLAVSLVLALFLSASSGAHPPTVGGAHEPRPEPAPEVLAAKIETKERELDARFETLLAVDPADSERVMAAWQLVDFEGFQLVLLRNRASRSRGFDGFLEMRERLLRRWEAERPESGGPALVRVRSGDLREEELRRAEMALLERYPDDPLTVWEVIGPSPPALDAPTRSILEGFVERNPECSIGHLLLYRNAEGNHTRQVSVLLGWARDVPGDPAILGPWMWAGLAEARPERTDRVLRDLFARQPGGDRGFEACRQAFERFGTGPHGSAALDCIRRIATDPETPLETQEKAGTFLLRRAVREDDRPELRSVLVSLPPEARARALIEASAHLPAEGCPDVVALTRLAMGEPMAEDLYRRATRILTLHFFDLPSARELYLELLAAAPGIETANVVWSGLVQGDDGWRGDLLDGAVAVLLERLEGESGPPVEIYQALDAAYQATERDSRRRAEYLERWQRDHPCDFDSFRAIELAELWGRLGEPERGIAVLERQAGRRSYSGLMETLWELRRQAWRESGAEPSPEGMLALLDPRSTWRAHELVARDALAAGDRATAELHLWEAARRTGSEEVARELFGVIESTDPKRAALSIRQICSLALRLTSGERFERCRSELIGMIGRKPTES